MKAKWQRSNLAGFFFFSNIKNLQTENCFLLFGIKKMKKTKKRRILFLSHCFFIYIIHILLFISLFLFYGCKNKYAISNNSFLKMCLHGLGWKDCLYWKMLCACVSGVHVIYTGCGRNTSRIYQKYHPHNGNPLVAMASSSS